MKKAEREEKEKLEAKEKEQKRIASGKDMGAIRQQIEEQEIKKMAEQRRREKQVSIQLGYRVEEDLIIQGHSCKKCTSVPPRARFEKTTGSNPKVPLNNLLYWSDCEDINC